MKLLTVVFFAAGLLLAQTKSSNVYEQMDGRGVVGYSSVRSNVPNGNHALPNAGLGDDFVAYLHLAGAPSYRRGERIVASLIVIKQLDGPVSVNAKLFRPGPSGQYDEKGTVAYIDLEGWGYYPGGINLGRVITVYAAEVGPDDPTGEYLLDVLITKNEQLVSQLFHRWFVSNTGPFGRGFYLSRTTAPQGFGDRASVLIQGRLPPSSMVNVFAGNVGQNWLHAPLPTSENGQYVVLGNLPPVPKPDDWHSPRQFWDVVVCVPGIRECFTLAKTVEVKQFFSSPPVATSN